MDRAITIRAERPGDVALIAGIVRRAYADVAYSDHGEHRMIDRLRGTGAYVPALSLLGEMAGEAVGHVLLTEARIRGEAGAVTTLALAPLSVVPEFRSRGVGRHLVRAAHERAAALGYGSIVLVGISDYYPQFGYVPLARYPITLPFDAPAETSLILPLLPGALEGVSGVVEYPPGWLDH